jgi:hypothetical protein
MNSAIEFGRKMVGGIAVAAALGAVVSAQHPGARQSKPGSGGSLEGDIRVTHGPRRASRPDSWREIGAVPVQNDLAVAIHIRPEVMTEPVALIPLITDLEKSISLSGGDPGEPGIIEILQVSELYEDASGGQVVLRLAGVFEADGVFSVEIPSSLSLHGLAARGIALSSRFVTVAVDLEAAADEVYAEWLDAVGIADPLHGVRGGSGRSFQNFGSSGGRASQATLSGRFVTVEATFPEGETDAVIGDSVSIPEPSHGAAAGSGQAFPRLSKNSGRAAQAPAPGRMVTFEVVLEDSNEVETEVGGFGSLPDPQLGTTAGSGSALPARPRGGHIRR